MVVIGIFILFIRFREGKLIGFYFGLFIVGFMFFLLGWGKFIEGFSREYEVRDRLVDNGVGMWMLKIYFRISGYLRRFRGSMEIDRGDNKMGNVGRGVGWRSRLG